MHATTRDISSRMKNLRHGVVLEEEVVDEQAGDEDDSLRLHEYWGY